MAVHGNTAGKKRPVSRNGRGHQTDWDFGSQKGDAMGYDRFGYDAVLYYSLILDRMLYRYLY